MYGRISGEIGELLIRYYVTDAERLRSGSKDSQGDVHLQRRDLMLKTECPLTVDR